MKFVPSFSILACDYDGTLATDGRVDPATVRALARVRASERKVVLITGRRIEDLQRVCPELGIFDLVVGENGAVMFWPNSGAIEMLAAPPPPAFAAELQRRGVTPLDVGNVVVATRREQLNPVRRVIREMDLDLDPILNKDSLMVLPCGVDKASGLQYVLEHYGVAAGEVIGVGDAENDEPFLRLCGFAVAVSNALPSIKEAADFVTSHSDGAGVVELIEWLQTGGLTADPSARPSVSVAKLTEPLTD